MSAVEGIAPWKAHEVRWPGMDRDAREYPREHPRIVRQADLDQQGACAGLGIGDDLVDGADHGLAERGDLDAQAVADLEADGEGLACENSLPQ